MSFGSKRHTLLEANWRIKTGYTQEPAFKTGGPTRRFFMTFAPHGRVSDVTIEQAVSICRPQGRRPSPPPMSTSGPSTGKKVFYGTPRKNSLADSLSHPATTPSPQVVSPWPLKLDKRLCKLVLSQPRCPSALSASPSGTSSVRSAGGSPKNAVDHYAYLLMQLCQQHKERRSRQVQSASLPASPAAIPTAAATALGGAGTGSCVAATMPSSLHSAGCSGCRFSPAYGTAEAVAYKNACAGGCSSLPASAAAASVCVRVAVSEEHNSSQGCSSQACCTSQVLHPFPASTSTPNTPCSGENSSSTGLARRHVTSTVAAAVHGRQRTAADEEGCDFLLGSPRHQKQPWQQPPQHMHHHQEQLLEQRGHERAFQAETRISRARFAQCGNEAASPGPPQEGKNSCSPGISIKPLACDPQCTCSSTCSNPCGRTSRSTPGVRASVNASAARFLHETTYKSALSNLACTPACLTACSNKVGAACTTACNTICSSSVCSTSRTYCCKSKFLVANGSVDLLQRQSCNSSSRDDFQEASRATAADEQNDLEYYVCSAADDIVGRHCESSSTWEASGASVFGSSQQGTNVQGGAALQNTVPGPAYASQQRSASRETWRLHAAKASGSRPRAAAERKGQQPPTGAAAGDAETAAARTAVGGEKGVRKEAREACMSRTYNEEIIVEGSCLDEQHRKLFPGPQHQEGITKSNNVYDNDLEMYEHHNLYEWIRKHTCMASSTFQATTPALAAQHSAATALCGSPTELYQKRRQQGSCSEDEKSVPETRASKQLNSSVSSFSSRPPLVVAGAKGKVERVTAAASRSSSVSASSSGGTQVAGQTSCCGSKSSVVSSPRSFSGTATTATKRRAPSSIVSSSSMAGRAEGPAHEAVECTEPIGDSELIKDRSGSQDNRLELREVPIRAATAAITAAEPPGTAGCSSFFPCLSLQRIRLASNRSSIQSGPVNSPAKEAVACSSADTPCSVVAADSVDTCHLQEEKLFRPEAAATAPPEAGALAVTAAAPATSTRDVATEPALPGVSKAPHSTATGTHNGTAQRLNSQTARDPDNELEIYEYKRKHCFLENDTILLRQSDTGETSMATNSSKMCWSRKEHSQVDAAAAEYTIVQTSPGICATPPARCSRYQKQKACASSQQQVFIAANEHVCATAGRQGMTKSATREEKHEKSGHCYPSILSSSPPAMHTPTGASQHCRDPQAVKRWLLQQKVWGACKACSNYGRGGGGAHNMCNKNRFCEERYSSNHVATSRTLYETTDNRPSSPVWLLAGEDAAIGEGSYSGEDIKREQRQHQPQWKEQRNTCMAQQTIRKKKAPHDSFVHQEEQHDSPRPPQQQDRAQRQQLAQQQHQQQPQRQRHLQQQQQSHTAQKQHQQQLGRHQQQSTQPMGRSSSAACKRQLLEDIIPTGRKAWHVAAYEDAVELKKKRHDLGNGRSRSCTSREKEFPTGGRAESADHADGKKQPCKEAARTTAVISTAFEEMHGAVSSCSSGEANSIWPLHPAYRRIDDKANSSTNSQQQVQWFQQQGGTQQQQQQQQQYYDEERRRTPLQEQQSHPEMFQARETQQQLLKPALQRQSFCSDAKEQYLVQQQHLQQARTQVPRQGNILRQPQEKEEDANQERNAFVAHYPMHTYHHLKRRERGNTFLGQNSSNLPPEETVSSLSWKCGAESDSRRVTKSSVQQRVENFSRMRQEEEMYSSSATGGTKVLRNACDNTHIDSCRIQGETNRNSEAHSYLSVAETLVYDKQGIRSRSPVLTSSLALSPASAPGQEEYPPLYGQQPARFSTSDVLQQQQDAHEKQFCISDTGCNTWFMQKVDCCRHQQQHHQQRRQQQQQQQHEQNEEQHQEQHRQQQQHQPQQHRLQRPQKQQPEQQQQQQREGEYETEANQTDQSRRVKQMTDREKHKSSQAPVVTLKCTCPVTPTFHGKTEAVGSC